MKKKLIALPVFLVLLIVFCCGSLVFATPAGAVKVYVDGNIQDFGKPVEINKGIIMVPLKGIFEVMGVEYTYDKAAKTVTATNSLDKVVMTLDAAEADVNGKKVTLSSPVAEQNGELVIPLNFAAESFGFKYTYNAGTMTAAVGTREKKEWWFKYPTQAEEQLVDYTDARVSRGQPGDFTWGMQNVRDSWNDTTAATMRTFGIKMVGYFEASGQLMTFAVGYKNTPQEGLPKKADNSAWGMISDDIVKQYKYFSYSGFHSDLNDDPIISQNYTRESLGYSIPKYPDGREALGYDTSNPDIPFPANTRAYDANCAKGINGLIMVDYQMEHPTVNKAFATVKVGTPTLRTYANKQNGDEVSFRLVCFSKDPASPLWYEENKVTAKEFAKNKVDGAWFDNTSPWDNFQVVVNGLGEWSIAKFRDFLKERFPADKLNAMGITDVTKFNVRDYLRSKAEENGCNDPDDTNAVQYKDTSIWINDPVWNAYKVFKSEMGSAYLKDLYKVMKDEAAKGGVKDGFMVSGNDFPALNDGWVNDDWMDVCATEISTGWNLTFGARGLTDIPTGKMACFYPTAHQNQSGPYSIVWYYASDKLKNKTEAGKVLLAEAFANSAFIKAADNDVGTNKSHRWLNKFANAVEKDFGVRYENTDIAIVYSTQDQLGHTVPGSIVGDMEKQYHIMGLWGFSHALVDAHIPFKVIPTWKLTTQNLKTVKTLVLPNVEFMEDSALPVLKEFVENGGRLVLTGPAGLRKGVEGMLEKRDKALLSDLVGKDISNAQGSDLSVSDANTDETIVTNTVGKGTVVWCAAPIGHTYFQNMDDRKDILPKILEMVGGTSVFDGSTLPSTVGSFCWKSNDSSSMFVDLVNYNVDVDKDVVTPEKNLTFKVKLPEGASVSSAKAYSPDLKTPVDVKPEVKDGWATVTLPDLNIYTSVKLSTASPTVAASSSSIDNATGESGGRFAAYIAIAAAVVIAAGVAVFFFLRSRKK